LKHYSKNALLHKKDVIDGFKKLGLIKDDGQEDLFDKFLTTFEKTLGNHRIIGLNKLLTTVLLLSKDYN
jgi:hypothetical protein